jgi:formylglycine-generating enzyme required for sulfatase activity
MHAARNSKSLGLETVVIQEGEFQMGSPATEANRRTDETRHKVRLSRPFLLGVYEVTQEEYEKVMQANPSWFCSKGEGRGKIPEQDTSRYPVENVTWYDALEFCNRLSKRDDFEPYYKLADVKRDGDTITSASVTRIGGNGYRLPTEAEWEYACRAGTTKAFYFGDASTGREANVKGVLVGGGYGGTTKWPDLGRTSKVGSYAANPWGLYDMHGNVAEWCWDWYDKDYYTNSPQDDPRGPDSGRHRVVRGGSWLVSEGSCRSASRFWHTAEERKEYAGFRVARSPGQYVVPGK